MWTHSTGVKFISLQLATLPNVNTFNRCQIYIITTCYTRYSEHIQQVSSSYHYTLEHSIFWIHATSVSFITLHLATLPKVNTFDRCLVHIITPCHTPYSEHIQQVSISYHYNLPHSLMWTHSTGVKFISLHLASLHILNTFNRCQVQIITTCHTPYSEHNQQVSISYHYNLTLSLIWTHSASVKFISLHLATLPNVNTFDKCHVHIITPCHTP